VKDFMVEFIFIKDAKSKEVQELVSAEKKQVSLLLKRGEMKDIWLKSDYSGGYFIAYQEDISSVDLLIESLPLKDYLDFKIYELKDKE
jgi:muconolactone delta-isomerase